MTTNPRESETTMPTIETDREIVYQILGVIDTPLMADMSPPQRLEFARLILDGKTVAGSGYSAARELWEHLSGGEQGLLTTAYHLAAITTVRGMFDLHRQALVAGYMSLWVGEWVREGRR